MILNFNKYSATGNDFVVIDNRNNLVDANNTKLWIELCHRQNGIGADGILLVESSKSSDFTMRYINADGSETAMCGNGSRAISHYVYHHLGLRSKKLLFNTMNGVYSSEVNNDFVSVKMTELYDYDSIKIADLYPAKASVYLNTGVPHAVFFVNNLDNINVYEVGKKVRLDKRFAKGCNVNFVELVDSSSIKIRTYERGVEAETLACGTGITAAVVACFKLFNYINKVKVFTRGGEISIAFNKELTEIFLQGTVKDVFHGSINI